MPGNAAGESRKTQIVQRFSKWLSKTFSRSADLKEEDETPYTLSNGAWVEKVDRIERYYKVLKTLGEGEFGQVKLVQCLETNRQVQVIFAILVKKFFQMAMKIIEMNDLSGKENKKPNTDHNIRMIRIQREIQILSNLNHPNIVKLHRILKVASQIALIIDFADGGELFDYVQSRSKLSEAISKIFMRQIILAVDYIHQAGIVHRDLKLENILVCSQENSLLPKILISDFGFANAYQWGSSSVHLTTACGSPCYAAPELVMGRDGYLGPAVDVWSCGVIMYSMLFGHLPFEHDLKKEQRSTISESSSSISNSDNFAWTPANVYQLYNFILSKPIIIPTNVNVSEEAKQLIRKMLNVNPTKRMTISEILNDPWLN